MSERSAPPKALVSLVKRFDPEVIVVLIGVWEGMATGAPGQYPLGSPAWERTYRDRLLQPYLDLLTSRGAKVVWVGMPPVPDAPPVPDVPGPPGQWGLSSP